MIACMMFFALLRLADADYVDLRRHCRWLLRAHAFSLYADMPPRHATRCRFFAIMLRVS